MLQSLPTQNAEKKDKIYWKIGKKIQENPELLIASANEVQRINTIRRLIASRKFAYMGV